MREHAQQGSSDLTRGADDRGVARGIGHGPVCYVIDADVQISRFLSLILHGKGVRSEEYSDAQSLLKAIDGRSPDLLFMNVGLDSTETVDLIEALGKKGYFGYVQLMSDRGSAVLEHTKKAVEKNKLIALPVLAKPFSADAVIKILHSLQLGDAPPAAAQFGLSEALARNWIEYWYQPKVDLRHKRLVGAEMFVRARHPEHGVVLPTTFLSDAGEGDLLSLAEHTVVSALDASSKYAGLGINLRFAFNMSMNELTKLPIPDIVRSHRSKSGTGPGVTIDIAEDQVVTRLDEVAEIAARMREVNVSLAIDDFGRAHSTLAKLKQSPFAEFKLGRAFVADCGTDKKRAPMCRTLIELAHHFDGLAVAVGLEKASEVVALVTMGCDHGQGFLLGHPMPEERFLSLLKLRSSSQKPAQVAQAT